MLFLKIKVVAKNSYHHSGGCCTFSLAKCALNIVSPFLHRSLAFFALLSFSSSDPREYKPHPSSSSQTIYLWIAHMRVIYRNNLLFIRARSLSWVSLAPTSLTIRVNFTCLHIVLSPITLWLMILKNLIKFIKSIFSFTD